MIWYLKALIQYADFEGRARRKEFWMYTLFNFLVPLSFTTLVYTIGVIIGADKLIAKVWAFYFIHAVATFIPTLAVMKRRLHDTNNSGWMYFVTLIPLIGSIWLIVLMCTEGDYGDNDYDMDPKAEVDNYSLYK